MANYGGPLYNVKELTRDHHPDREDERRRVEAAGGYVLEWAGVYRVNCELALSRAIGDVPFKRLVRNLLSSFLQLCLTYQFPKVFNVLEFAYLEK